MHRPRHTTVVGAVGAAAAVAVASAGLAPGPAAAGEPGSGREHRAPITAHPSEHTPRVGEQFVVRGVYDGPGPRAHDVKIQTFRDDEWLNLDGARVTARSDGSYRVRVILRIRGVRDLRAVGIAGNGRPNSYARFVVEVLR
jgi:hypothetical protein